MPALSQNFEFIINGDPSVSVVYPNTGTTILSYTSEPLKSAGYYGMTEGNHTVYLSVSNFQGIVEIQATLELNPEDFDWFPVKLGTSELSVDTTGLVTNASLSFINYTSPGSGNSSYNFIGNYIWLRCKIRSFTAGSVNKILINF